MKTSEIISMSLQSLKANKLRSSLTILGIVIGIFSIISISTVIAMLQNSVESGLSELGKDTFQIQKWPPVMGNHRHHNKYRKNLTIDEYYRLRDVLKIAKYVGAEQWRFGNRVKSKWYLTNPNIQMAGFTPEALTTNQMEVATGRAINQSDMDYNHYVCVLGNDLAETLFKQINPIDQEIRVNNNLRLRVVGVLKSRGQIFGQSRDSFLVIPLTVFQNIYGKNVRSVAITVMAHGPLTYNATIEAAIGYFRTIRKVPAGEENNFDIFSNDSLISQMNNMTAGIKIGSILVAMIALLAAGVGIMNIMLVSVTERTREIGIRKALGAKKRSIMIQFLVEAVTLSQIGGLIGIITGLAAGNTAGSFLNAPPAFPIEWIITGVVLCIVVGVSFGTYPAYKAANLDPIEALRYE